MRNPKPNNAKGTMRASTRSGERRSSGSGMPQRAYRQELESGIEDQHRGREPRGCTGQAWAADEAGSASARLEPAQPPRPRLLEVGAGEQGMVAHQCGRPVGKHLLPTTGATADTKREVEIVGDEGDGGALPRQAFNAPAPAATCQRRRDRPSARRAPAAAGLCRLSPSPGLDAASDLATARRGACRPAPQGPIPRDGDRQGRGQFLTDAAGQELALRVLEADAAHRARSPA